MQQNYLVVLLLGAAALSPFALSAAWAQAAPDGPAPDPLDAKASAPRLFHVSPFSGYHAFADEEVASWQETNDNAGKIGGWRVYAREARQPAPVAPAVQSPGAKPAPSVAPEMRGGHDAHGKH